MKQQSKDSNFRIGDLVHFRESEDAEQLIGLIIDIEKLNFGHNDQMIYYKLYTHDIGIKKVYSNLVKEKIYEQKSKK